MDAAAQLAIYVQIFRWALLIPITSVLGVVLAAQGYEYEDIERIMARLVIDLPEINWWILGGGLSFALFLIVMGFANVPYNEELIFVGSLAIVMFLMVRLTDSLSLSVKKQLFGTALVIFAFRAILTTGAGST